MSPGAEGPRRAVLITGGAGFIGCNLADRLAADGAEVLILDSLARPGVERNRDWLLRRHAGRVRFLRADVCDAAAVDEAVAQSCAVFHFAAQVAVTTSMTDPRADFAVNARGTFNVLEAVRRGNPRAPVIFASTNKVYGDLADLAFEVEAGRHMPQDTRLREHGLAESRRLCFHTPYGCSKGAADQYVLDYARSFGLRTAVLRMSCIYGERQLGTEDQGWVAHFLLRARAGTPITIYGDGRQVRDVLHVGDAVRAYIAAWRDIDRISGRAFNLGGGPANAVSLRELLDHLARVLERRIEIDVAAWRPGDQRWFVADTRAIRAALDLPAPLGWRAGLARLAAHFAESGRAELAVAP